MPDIAESRRYCASLDGVIHRVVDTDFSVRLGVYLTACGQRIEARTTTPFREKTPPGVLCKRCAAVAADDTAE
jgi:hypothetical protein